MAKKYEEKIIEDNITTAILVDGAFYRKRFNHIFGYKDPKVRADELDNYVKKHLYEKINGVTHHHQLYRVFYYDCPPSSKAIYNPITKK